MSITTIESVLYSASQLAGVEVVAVGETTESLLIGGIGSPEQLQRLVRHQSFLFQQQADMLEDTGWQDGLAETLVTLNHSYHITRFLLGEGTEGMFLYVVLNREGSNLGMARVKLAELAQNATLTPQLREKYLETARADEIGHYKYPEAAPTVTPPLPPHARVPEPKIGVPTQRDEPPQPTSAGGSPTAIREGRLRRMLSLSRKGDALPQT